MLQNALCANNSEMNGWPPVLVTTAWEPLTLIDLTSSALTRQASSSVVIAWVPIIRPPTAGSPPGAEDDGAELTLTRMNNNTASVMELASVSLASIRHMNVVEYTALGHTDWIRIRGSHNPVRGDACIDG